MTDKQAQSLVDLLNGVLRDSPMKGETLANFSLYTKLRDAALGYLGQPGPEGLRRYVSEQAAVEQKEGYTAFVPYSEVMDILFGDITLTPPHFDTYPTLCKWRLSLSRPEEASKMQEPATVMPPAPAIDDLKA